MAEKNDNKILWLVAARSSSKSIPDKNIKLLGGLPLLAYRIKSVLSFAAKEDIWISTDSEHYAEIAKAYGATVPFIRPKALASDTAASVDVVLHAMDHADSLGKKYTGIGLLEPTSPFVSAANIEEAVNILCSEPEAENIVAVRHVRYGKGSTSCREKTGLFENPLFFMRLKNLIVLRGA